MSTNCPLQNAASKLFEPEETKKGFIPGTGQPFSHRWRAESGSLSRLSQFCSNRSTGCGVVFPALMKLTAQKRSFPANFATFLSFRPIADSQWSALRQFWPIACVSSHGSTSAQLVESQQPDFPSACQYEKSQLQSARKNQTVDAQHQRDHDSSHRQIESDQPTDKRPAVDDAQCTIFKRKKEDVSTNCYAYRGSIG